MKYWLDTEFIEDGTTIDLISIGIVAEDGREYYRVNSSCDFRKASGWARENVLKPMGISIEDWYGYTTGNQTLLILKLPNDFCLTAKPKTVIVEEVLEFLFGTDERPTIEGYLNTEPEFWGYYADYDWVVFCQLFGTMMDLPKGFPMYCRDIKQWCDQIGNPRLPEQGKGEHNTLADARWNKQAWEFLHDYQSKIINETQQAFTKMAKQIANEVALNKYQDEE